MSVHLDYPFAVDAAGRSARTDEAGHVRDMIEQLLFTAPGERVNRPDFGTGVLQLVFGPNSPEFAAAVEYTLLASLQQWLADVITVQQVDVEALDASLQVTVSYALRLTGEPATVTVERRTAT